MLCERESVWGVWITRIVGSVGVSFALLAKYRFALLRSFLFGLMQWGHQYRGPVNQLIQRNRAHGFRLVVTEMFYNSKHIQWNDWVV